MSPTSASLDATDRLASLRHHFHIPEGVVYLDGNSLGPMSHATRQRLLDTLDFEWSEGLIRSWNAAGWMQLPLTLGDQLAPLIGAGPSTVVVSDTLTYMMAKMLHLALSLRPQRRVILTETGNFHSDLYVADAVARLQHRDIEVRRVDKGDIGANISDDVAVVMLTHVDFRTGEMWSMPEITSLAHDHGALAVWDLAHSTGAVEVHLDRDQVDFAAGCTYKYLNAGPGAPAFGYVNPRWLDHVQNLLPGWLGHARPFAFESTYESAPGVAGLITSSPSVLALSALRGALDVWDHVAMADVRAKSLALTDFFIEQVTSRLPGVFVMQTPREHIRRGSQVSLQHAAAFGIVQALIARGVIGDFRDPDVARFGFAPLYLSFADVERAVDELVAVMTARDYDRPEFNVRRAVT